MSSSPVNAAASWVARLATDEQSGEKLSIWLSESVIADSAAVTLVDNGQNRWQLAIHFNSIPDQQKVRALIATAIGSARAKQLRFERLATQDWVKASLEGLRPIQVGRFFIHGAHHRGRIPLNRIGIEIEAALAFGTGHHGTTRGCLFALDRICRSRLGRQWRVLDVGTGSGVLAIAAARALRQHVLATDVDPEAVRVARANAGLNCVGAFVNVVKADGVAGQRVRAQSPFDLVFANILLGPLQRLAAPLIKMTAPGGRIILSGLLSSQANAAIAAYRPLALERRIDIGGWTTLVLARRTRPHRAVAARRRGP